MLCEWERFIGIMKQICEIVISETEERDALLKMCHLYIVCGKCYPIFCCLIRFLVTSHVLLRGENVLCVF